jgi:hypothetical protein
MSINSKKTSEKIFQNLYQKRIEQRNPVGFVQLFDLKKTKKKIFEHSNLVVGLGRQYISQKIVTSNIMPSGYTLTELPSGCDNLRHYNLTHYAFGGGGAIYSGGNGMPDDVELTGPDICDTNLSRPITFGVDTYLNDPGEIDEGDGIHMSEKCVKPINFGNNSYEYSIKEYPIIDPTCSYYTQFHFTLYKEEGEFGPLDVGQSVQVSEAGLYITYLDSALLFARICFPPKFMEKESQYGMEWYLLC